MKYRTVAEVEAAADAARREGKIKKEDLDWFRYSYKEKMQTALKRQHQNGELEDQEICRT